MHKMGISCVHWTYQTPGCRTRHVGGGAELRYASALVNLCVHFIFWRTRNTDSWRSVLLEGILVKFQSQHRLVFQTFPE